MGRCRYGLVAQMTVTIDLPDRTPAPPSEEITIGDVTDLQLNLDAKQPLDADLTAIAANGTSAAGLALLVAANAAAQRTALSLVPGTNVQAYDADLTALAARPQLSNSTSANLFSGSAPALLTPGAVSGDHDGDSNTGFGFGMFASATTAYASAAFGLGALSSVTEGHSNTALAYQALGELTTGIMNTAIGVDAGRLALTMNYNTIVGHHTLNGGAFTGEGGVFIGQQTARNFTSGDYMIWIGRNAGANSPATGSANCVVIGGVAGIAGSINGSVVIGKDAVVATAAITTSVIIGNSALYGGGTVNSNAIVGVETFFRASGGGGSSNSSLGYQTGYSIAGTGNTLLGYRAGYRGSNTTVNSAVCIGNLAGFNAVTSGDLYIGNSDALSAHLIWGNFGTQVLKLRANSLTLVELPNYATTQAASSGGHLEGVLFYDDSGYLRRVPASPNSDTFAAAVTFGSTFRSKGYTVATLPAAGTAGRRAHVTDATAPTYLGALTGGGAVTCPVFDNGSAWVSA